jgi:hypothetical protein
VIPVVIDVGKHVAVLVVRILHTSIPPLIGGWPTIYGRKKNSDFSSFS